MANLVDIRPHERRAAILAFATLASVMAAHALLETARDALFLASLPASRLPWVYLAIAALGIGVTRVAGRRTPTGRGLGGWLVLSAAITLGLWLLTRRTETWVLYLLYVWPGLFATVAVVQFWLLLGKHFTVTEAKRVFGLVGTGAILGAIAGSALARGVAEVAQTRHAVLLAAACLGAGAILPLALGRSLGTQHATGEGTPLSLVGSFEQIRRHSYARGLALLVLLATVAFTLLDYVFKSVVASEIPPDRLAHFFATFNVTVNVGSLVVQLVLVSVVIHAVSLAMAVSVLPLLAAGGATAVVLGGGLVAAIALKGADGMLRHSLHRTAMEVLYVPMSDHLRAAIKPFIDVVGHRGGQALASLIILGVIASVSSPTAVSALLIVVTAVGWIVVALKLRPLYLDLFRQTLDDAAVRTRVDFPELDVRSLEQLIARLNSSSDDEVIAVIDLLAQLRRARLLPDLILYHPAPSVVIRALDEFAAERRRSFLPLGHRLAHHPHPGIRSAAICAVVAVDHTEALARAAADDPSPEVAAAAWACRAFTGDDVESPHTLFRRLRERGPGAEVALAQAIRRLPSDGCVDALQLLASCPDTQVRIEAARAATRVRDVRLLPALTAMLGERATRTEARTALVAIGAPALEALDRALADRSLPDRVRHHIPRTISRFDPRAATRVLVSHLAREHDEVVYYKLLRGLGRLRAENPRVRIDRARVGRAIEVEVRAAYRLLHWRVVIAHQAARQPASEELDLLLALLDDKRQKALERAFRVVGILYPRDHLEHIYRGLHSPDRRAQASGWELLGSIVRGPLRASLLALVDDIPDGERLHHALPYYDARPITYSDCLTAIVRDWDDEALRALAVAICRADLRRSATTSREEALDATV